MARMMWEIERKEVGKICLGPQATLAKMVELSHTLSFVRDIQRLYPAIALGCYTVD